jgi:hypothetical protein
MSFLSSLFKKTAPSETYDPAKLQPAIRASICTGERVAGFIETGTGRFREIMLLRDDADLRSFRKRYGIKGEIKTIY